MQRIFKFFSGFNLTKIPFIRIIRDYYITTQKLSKNYVLVHGSKMFPGQELRGHLILNRYEPTTTWLIKNIIKSGYNVIDIGANIGYFTLLLAKLVGTRGIVYSIEPEPRNFLLLRRNIQLNDYRNVILEKKAISNKKGEISFLLSTESCPRITLESNLNNENMIFVETIPLDNYFQENIDINFIKMDIEGAEYHAVKGMSNLIEQNKTLTMVSEFYPELLRMLEVEPSEYLELLSSHGFHFYNINEYKKKVERTNKKELLRIYDEKRPFTNLYLKR